MKIRKWIFKLLTGYDLVEYKELIHEWTETINCAKEIAALNEELCNTSKQIINLNKKLLETRDKENRNETLD